jgi:hypothetical protein
MNDPTSIQATAPKTCPVRPFWRRLGAAAFLIFFIKGLLWLIVPALVAMGLWR